MASAGAGISKSADFPGVSVALDLNSAAHEYSSPGSAHDSIIESLQLLVNRLVISDDAKISETKRVTVRGLLFTKFDFGLKFAVEFRGGKPIRIRVMTAHDDEDEKAALPIEYGGTGLMAPAGAGAGSKSEDEAAPKRKRAKTTPEPETLEALLHRAAELARLNTDTYTAEQLELLLKRL
jgi:hypothetical protein